MTHLNIHEAKTHLSRYIQQVQEGKVITLCRHDVPVALLTPLPSKKRSKKNLFGLARGRGEVTEEFFDELTDKDLPGMGLKP